ncbi:hypothetical protein, partial [Roseburia sp. 1XD42-69]|uniref:hypothetical protein n=1 Tax=Roseburia sp. 1XD42-69 TaxID=2320088 RepID=UPI001A9AD73E
FIERLPVLHQHFHPLRKGGSTCGSLFPCAGNPYTGNSALPFIPEKQPFRSLPPKNGKFLPI